MSDNERFHLIIKYGNQLAQGRDTIQEHRRVLKEQGIVWFGKVGAGLGNSTITMLSKQISDGGTTYLFLYSRSDQTNIYRGKVVTIEAGRPTMDAKAIPEYYAESGIIQQMKLWIKLSSLTRFGADALAKYHTASSGKKALHTVSRSMASVFVIAEGVSALDAS